MSISLLANDELPIGGPDPADEMPPGIDGDAYPRDLDEQHKRLVRWYEEAERSSTEARQRSERDRAYKNGEQWTAEEKKELVDRHQPITTVNYISRKVELLCGYERKARTDPKAFARTPTEDERADAATQALRYIADDQTFSIKRSQVYENMLVEGFGGVELGLEDDGQGGANVTINYAPWDRIWYDPHSRSPDFEDARYKGLVVWMDRDQAEETYPDSWQLISDTFDQNGGTYDDRPGSVAWQDTTRTRVRIVSCHWLEAGDWWEATFSRAGLLVEPQRSMMRDKKGRTACRLILQSAYVDQENNRFGMVRDLISLQDEINKRRSKALHLLTVNRTIAERGAVEDVDHAQREAARPDGFIEVTPGMRFEILSGGELAMGQFNLLQQATAEMQASGPNASMTGNDPRELSGRAILAQQAGGAAQNEPLADALRQWARRVYEMAWMAAREYWSPGRFVRVTDELGTTRWLGINRQVTLRDALVELPEEQRVQVMQQMQLVPNDPRLQQVVRVDNQIDDLDCDIIVQEGIDVPAQAAENFQTLVQLAGMQPGLIPADVLIAASSLKNKDDLLARMKAHMEEQKAKQEAAEPVIRANAIAEVEGKQAKAAADHALAAERQANTVGKVHAVHAEFAAPPYGQPNVADNAVGQGGAGKAPEPFAEEQAAANILMTAAQAKTEEAKQRDLHFSSVKKAAETHAILHPPPPKPAAPRRG